jgi:hypothetical protein
MSDRHTVDTSSDMQTKSKQSGAEDQEPSGADRRRSHREPVFTIGRISCVDADGVCNQEVMVTDVSLHGCGFRCNVELDETSVYEIEIGVGPLHLSSKLRIVRIRLRADGTYDIGSQFC